MSEFGLLLVLRLFLGAKVVIVRVAVKVMVIVNVLL